MYTTNSQNRRGRKRNIPRSLQTLTFTLGSFHAQLCNNLRAVQHSEESRAALIVLPYVRNIKIKNVK